MTTLQDGNKPLREIDSDEAQRLMEEYLNEHGCSVSYITLDSLTGEVQIKAPRGFKAVLKYVPAQKGFEIILC